MKPTNFALKTLLRYRKGERGNLSRTLGGISLPSFGGYSKDQSGAIAVETAILTPVVIFGMMAAANLGFTVFKHQKVHSATYAGISYLQDEVAKGDFSGLRSTSLDNGEKQPGNMAQTAKLVIKDASGLPLQLDQIIVDTYCGCPQKRRGDNNDSDSDDEEGDKRHMRSFEYQRTEMSSGTNPNICPTNCSNGDISRIIAEVSVSYDSSNLNGSTETIRESILTRLR